MFYFIVFYAGGGGCSDFIAILSHLTAAHISPDGSTLSDRQHLEVPVLVVPPSHGHFLGCRLPYLGETFSLPPPPPPVFRGIGQAKGIAEEEQSHKISQSIPCVCPPPHVLIVTTILCVSGKQGILHFNSEAHTSLVRLGSQEHAKEVWLLSRVHSIRCYVHSVQHKC